MEWLFFFQSFYICWLYSSTDSNTLNYDRWLERILLHSHAFLLVWIISKMQQQFYMKDVNLCATNYPWCINPSTSVCGHSNCCRCVCRTTIGCMRIVRKNKAVIIIEKMCANKTIITYIWRTTKTIRIEILFLFWKVSANVVRALIESITIWNYLWIIDVMEPVIAQFCFDNFAVTNTTTNAHACTLHETYWDNANARGIAKMAQREMEDIKTKRTKWMIESTNFLCNNKLSAMIISGWCFFSLRIDIFVCDVWMGQRFSVQCAVAIINCISI